MRKNFLGKQLGLDELNRRKDLKIVQEFFPTF